MAARGTIDQGNLVARRNVRAWRGLAVDAWVLGIVLYIGGTVLAGNAWGGPADGGAPSSSGHEKVTEADRPEALPPVLSAARAGRPASLDDILAIIDREAGRAGLPPEIAEAVTHTESRFNRNAVGGDGEIGLMQVLPSTARMMGFSGNLGDLAVPETNIRYGVTYLARAWRLAGGDICTAVMKYRAGHGESRFSHLSVDYCLKVRARLASRGYQVAGVVPVATFGSMVAGGSSGRCRGRCLSGSGRGADLAALNSKLSQIAFRVTVVKVPMR